eukprot:m.1296276 g.1296276  ORF g.1296276 m.1296276 type:complete len:210 (+) comp24794_c0_seq12:6233-6862(+)
MWERVPCDTSIPEIERHRMILQVLNDQAHRKSSVLFRFPLYCKCFVRLYLNSSRWCVKQVLFRRMLVLVMYVTLYSDEKKRKYAIFVVSLAILMTHMVCLPYKHAKDNTVESISLASLVYAAGTVMTDDAGTSTTILHTTMIATLIGMGTVAFFDVGSTMYYSLSKGSRKMSDEDDRSVASMSVPNKDLNSSETAFQTDYVSIQGDATE